MSAAIAIRRSSSVFSAVIWNGPDVGKSEVRSIGTERVITTVDPPLAPVTDIEMEPVAPEPPVTV